MRGLIDADMRFDPDQDRLGRLSARDFGDELLTPGTAEGHLRGRRYPSPLQERSKALVCSPHSRGVLLGGKDRNAEKRGYLEQKRTSLEDPFPIFYRPQETRLHVDKNED